MKLLKKNKSTYIIQCCFDNIKKYDTLKTITADLVVLKVIKDFTFETAIYVDLMWYIKLRILYHKFISRLKYKLMMLKLKINQMKLQYIKNPFKL